jgi:hypothetical protein
MWKCFSINQELKAEGKVVLDVGRLLPDIMHPAVPLTFEMSYNGFRWNIGVEWWGRQERKGETCMLTGVGYGTRLEGSRQQHCSDGRVGSGGLVFLDGLVFRVECLGLAGDPGGAEAIRPMEVRWVWEALVDEKALASDDAEWGGAGGGLELMSTDREEVGSVSSISYSSSDSRWSKSIDTYDEDWLPNSEETVSSASSDSAGSEEDGSSEGESANSDDESSGSNEADSLNSEASWGVCSSSFSDSSYTESHSGSESDYEYYDLQDSNSLQRRKSYFRGHACFDWGVYTSEDWARWLMKPPQMEKEEVLRRWSFDSSFNGKGVMVEELVGEDEQLRALARHGGVWLRCYLHCR